MDMGEIRESRNGMMTMLAIYRCSIDVEGEVSGAEVGKEKVHSDQVGDDECNRGISERINIMFNCITPAMGKYVAC